MTAGNTGPPRRRWTDADGISALQQAVTAALQESPYKVIDTEGGFEVELPPDDEEWRGVMSRGWRHRELRWVVKERPGSYAVTDVAGYSQGSVGLTGFRGSFSKQVGRVPSFTRTTIWALTDTGAIERVAGFRFNTREVRDVIRLAARQLGLKERLPQSVKAAIAGLAVTALAAGALIVWLIRHPGQQGSPVVPEAKANLISAARDVVTATTPRNLDAGFTWRSCDCRGIPYRGELDLRFDLPAGQPTPEALDAVVRQLSATGWTDGLPPGRREPRDGRPDNEIATLHRGQLAALVRPPIPQIPQAMIVLNGPCDELRRHKDTGWRWDVTGDVR